MKKTLTANISGTVFHIEEDAFDNMNRYLESIRSQFVGSHGAEEIMSDIESRISELLQERLDGRRQVVSMSDVDHVIAIMGQPEDYLAPGEEDTATPPPPGAGSTNWNQTAPRRKRLFRDTDDKWIGGVLGGVGAYFSIDPLILRVIYIVLLFLGVGWLIYLILWIVLPPALTAAEKLEMRGEPVNVENIKRVFDQGTDRVRTGAERVGKEAEEIGRKYAPHARRGLDEFFNFLGDLFRMLFNAFGKVVGVILLLGGAVVAMLFMMVLLGEFRFLGYEGMSDVASLHDLLLLMLGDPLTMNLAWLAVACTVLIPLIGCIHGGLSLLFNISSPRWFGWTLGIVWIVAFFVLTTIGFRVAADMRQREMVETRHALVSPTDAELRLTCDQGGQTLRHRRDDNLAYVHVESNTVNLGWATVDVRQSKDSLYHLVIQRRARGGSYKAANNRAAGIEAGWEQRDGALDLPSSYSFDSGDLFRAQMVRYILEVPVGGSVVFDESMGGMLDDIANVNGTLDAKMIGYTWTMTEAGLESDEAPVTSSKRSVKDKKKRSHSWSIKYGNPERTTEASTATLWYATPDLLGILFRRI